MPPGSSSSSSRSRAGKLRPAKIAAAILLGLEVAKLLLEVLKRRGKALLYTTHYMEEAERLADRIVVIDHGRVIADDTLAGLQAQVGAAPGGRATLESVFLTLTGRSLRD